MSKEIQQGTYRNPHSRLPSEALPRMTERWAAHLEERHKADVLDRIQELTPDEREVRKRLRESQLRMAGVDGTLLAQVREQRANRARQLAKGLTNLPAPHQAPRPLPDPPHVLDSPNGMGELWWAQTNWSWNDPGITPFWDNSAGLRFAGEIGDPLDVYMRRNLTMVAQFGLGVDRIPPDLVGSVVSAPMANVFGAVRGITTAGLWDFGDQWCKCWLNLRQTVWAHLPFVSVPIGSNSSVITLIDIDGNGLANNFFPGPIQMPPVQFGLNSFFGIEVDLEFWFDIQLEGDNTDIIFGNDPQFQTNLIQTFQWSLTRV